eukprot:TRINITY_DN16584_c0_g1_i1.p1 TRINITY_DN16584_c0_g1~~TRINITY_DN16584_c0_g1_i1.p1  ORF type:complete len:196 (+),score=27.11 TRINITY_DN16584_c0_g1_i1:31-618(+)
MSAALEPIASGALRSPRARQSRKDRKKIPTISESVSQSKYNGTVSRIGVEPFLWIDGLGEVRFSYRSVKKLPKTGKPYLQVGDVVECRITVTLHTRKAVSVRLLRAANGTPIEEVPTTSDVGTDLLLAPKQGAPPGSDGDADESDADSSSDGMPPLLSSVSLSEAEDFRDPFTGAATPTSSPPDEQISLPSKADA